MLKRNAANKPRKKKTGQSTVEYIVLVAAVIGALVIFLPNTFKNAYDATLNSATNGMENMADRLRFSRPVAP